MPKFPKFYLAEINAIKKVFNTYEIKMNGTKVKYCAVRFCNIPMNINWILQQSFFFINEKVSLIKKERVGDVMDQTSLYLDPKLQQKIPKFCEHAIKNKTLNVIMSLN
jgi:hypothetical protein